MIWFCAATPISAICTNQGGNYLDEWADATGELGRLRLSMAVLADTGKWTYRSASAIVERLRTDRGFRPI